MPDLGKYAADVLLAYGVTLSLLVGLVAVSWRQARVSKRALEKLEDG